jgi:hypothetical protein
MLADTFNVYRPDWLRRSARAIEKAFRTNMRSYPKVLRGLSKVLFIGAIGLATTALPTHANSYLSGTYMCTKAEVAGKEQPCSAPSLELKSDGSYQILAERGTYEILSGHWLVLSTSKNHGKARLDGSREIIFEFVSGGKKSTITYRRKYQRPPEWMVG